MSRLNTDERLARSPDIPTLGSSFVPQAQRIAADSVDDVVGVFQAATRTTVSARYQQARAREIEERRVADLKQDSLSLIQTQLVENQGLFDRTEDTAHLNRSMSLLESQLEVEDDPKIRLSLTKALEDVRNQEQGALELSTQEAVMGLYDGAVQTSRLELLNDNERHEALIADAETASDLQSAYLATYLEDLSVEERQSVLEDEHSFSALRTLVNRDVEAAIRYKGEELDRATRLSQSSALRRLASQAHNRPTDDLVSEIQKQKIPLEFAVPTLVEHMGSLVQSATTADEALDAANGADKIASYLADKDPDLYTTEVRALESLRRTADQVVFNETVLPTVDRRVQEVLQSGSSDVEHMNRHIGSIILQAARHSLDVTSLDLSQNQGRPVREQELLQRYRDIRKTYQLRSRAVSDSEKALSAVFSGTRAASDSDIRKAMDAEPEVMARLAAATLSNPESSPTQRVLAQRVMATGDRKSHEGIVLLHASQNELNNAGKLTASYVQDLLDPNNLTEENIELGVSVLRETSITGDPLDNLHNFDPKEAFAIGNAIREGGGVDEYLSAVGQWEQIVSKSGGSADNLLADPELLGRLLKDDHISNGQAVTLSSRQQSKFAGILGYVKLDGVDGELSVAALAAHANQDLKALGMCIVPTRTGSEEHRLISSRATPEYLGVSSSDVERALNERSSRPGTNRLRHLLGTDGVDIDHLAYEALKKQGVNDLTGSLDTIQGFRDQFRSGRLRYIVDSARVNGDGVPIILQITGEDGEDSLEVGRVNFNSLPTPLKDLTLKSKPKRSFLIPNGTLWRTP